VHRRDLRHRLELSQHFEDAIRPPQCRAGEPAQGIDPLSPGRALLQCVELFDDGKSKRAKVIEARELMVDDTDAARLRLLAGQLVPAAPQLFTEPAQAPVPSFFAADHRRLDQQLFPTIGLAEVAVVCRVIVGDLRRAGNRLLDHELRFVEEGPLLGCAPRIVLRRIRHLPERQILAESFRAQPLRRTGDESEQRPSSGIGTAAAAREVRRNVGAGEGRFEMRLILRGSAKKDGHLIERRAAPGMVDHRARDLHRLSPLARRGEEGNRVVELRPGQ